MRRAKSIGKKPPGNVMVAIWLTREDHEILEKLSREADLSKVGFIRFILLRALRGEITVKQSISMEPI